MKNTHLKKFALIGLPGSGKSTFASKLGKILDSSSPPGQTYVRAWREEKR